MNNDYHDLEKKVRKIRRIILEMAVRARSAHTGGSLSCVEILVTLYFSILHIDPQYPNESNRDRLIFSKAHDCKALYAVLAEKGFFDKEILTEYEQDGGRLSGHATRHAVAGIEVSAGSLGHGLSLAAGMAFAGKLNNKLYRVFAVLSDGECDEGSTWEAILFAAHHKLDNLVTIVDYNKLQGFGRTTDVLNLEPFTDKWRSFGWEVKEVDGHAIGKLDEVLQTVPFKKDKPSVIIAHTIKGLGGVDYHINKVSSHYKSPTQQEIEALLKEKL